MERLEARAAPESLQEYEPDARADVEDDYDGLVFDVTQDPSLHALREISTLASWTVSTHKPTCGTTALLSPSVNAFWQSDGPQPHLLTAHFFKLVKVVRLRVYLDFALDESYTPTRMEFWAGWASSGYGMVQFAEWKAEEPRGWQEIKLEGVGVMGRDEVRCMVLQVRVIENHQNGKDTHVRGIQVFAADERAAHSGTLTNGAPTGRHERTSSVESAADVSHAGAKQHPADAQMVAAYRLMEIVDEENDVYSDDGFHDQLDLR